MSGNGPQRIKSEAAGWWREVSKDEIWISVFGSAVCFLFVPGLFLIISQRNKPQWKNLPSLLTHIQINVCRVLQIHKVCFMLVPSLWAEISDTVTEQVSSSQRKESAAIVGNNWRCCCYLLLPKNKDSKL